MIFSENLKKFPMKYKAVSFSGFVLQGYWLQYFILFLFQI